MVLRYLPHVVDTVLLTTALMLTTVIHQYPFAAGWLTAKVVLLVALHRARQHRAEARTHADASAWRPWSAALLTVGFLVTVARAHHPLGVLAGL